MLSLALQSVSPAEQIGKRAKLDEKKKYLYFPLQNISVRVQLNIFRGDRTHLSDCRWLQCISLLEKTVTVIGPSVESGPV